MDEQAKHYNIPDVARMFDVTRQRVHAWIESGRFEGVFRLGREWLFREGTRIKEFKRGGGLSGILDAYIEACKERGVEPTIPVHDFIRKGEKTNARAIPSEIEQHRLKREVQELEDRITRLALDPRDTVARYLQRTAVLHIARDRLAELGDERALPIVEEELE